MPSSSRSYRDYTIGWVCAVEPELIAAMAMLDDIHHDKLPAVDGDSNNYKFGRIGEHNVVIASLPSGNYGTNPAASVAGQMRRTFRWLRFGLLVGIGGGVPRLTDDDPADIRLGDVVVSNPTYDTGGVIQYDRGKTNEGEQRPYRTGTLNQPPESILTAVMGLKANHALKDYPLADHLAQMICRRPKLAPTYEYQGEDNDILFEVGYRHAGSDTDCAKCLKERRVLRNARESSHPRIHYGMIGSGNQVIKDSVTRDYWGKQGVLCFEMEAAGLMNNFPCLVIRGICDYADSHKNQIWQPYAAATAAAYAKELLLEIAPTALQATEPLPGGQPESGNVHSMVPKNANLLFTGRTKILKQLADNLRPQSQMSKQRKIFVIVGYGGIGKSELLILDNADNPDIDYANFLPSGNEGNIILTTRNPQCCDHATIGCTEDLDHLDLQDATSLLFGAARIPESARKDNQEAAEKVVQALSSHTLAIVQAGAYIKQRRFSLEEYSTLFKQQEEQLLKYCPKQDQSTYGSVYKTFEISATHLESSADQSAADALSLLQILGFFHFQEIPELMFSRAWKEANAIHEDIDKYGPRDEIYHLSELQISRLPLVIRQGNDSATDLFQWRWWQTLDLLESYSLIKISRVDDSLSFSMHPLAHTWTRIRHGLEIQKEGWRAAGSIIALSMCGDSYDMFHEKLRSHVGAYLDHPVLEYMAEMPELEICQTHYQICRLLSHLDDTSKLRFLLQILEKFKAWIGASGESSLQIQTLTAHCLIKEGKHRAAVELMERLVETDESHDLYRQMILANAYQASQQYQKAVTLLEHIVEIRESKEAPESMGLSWSQHELGRAYIKNKQFEKAATLFEKVVELGKKILVPTHRDLLASQHSLGVAYLRIKKYEKAAEILQQVFEIQCKVLDVKDRYLLGTKHELAVTYIEMGDGRHEIAAELLEQVVGVREKTLAFDDRELLKSQYWLAEAYIGMGKDHYERAAKLLEHIIGIQEKTLAPDDPKLLASQHSLARAYIDMGKDYCERAAKLLEHVIQIREKTLAPDDPHILALQHWLAEACIGMGNDHYGRAAEILEQVLRIDEKTLAPDDPRSLKAQQLFEEVNRLIQAEKDAESMTTSGEAV